MKFLKKMLRIGGILTKIQIRKIQPVFLLKNTLSLGQPTVMEKKNVGMALMKKTVEAIRYYMQ